MTTKQKIYTTALELAEKRDIERITVKDIIEACGVSRQTFYYYFRDLEDLFEVVAEETGEQLLDKIRSGMSLELWLREFLDLMQEKKKVYPRILYSSMGIKALHMMQDIIRKCLAEYVKQNSGQMNERWTAQEMLLLIDFYAGGIFNLMRKLVEEDYVDVDRMLSFVANAMQGQIHL